MSDWIDGLTDEVVKAHEQNREKQVQKEHVLHVSKVLGTRAAELWRELVEACEEALKNFNDRVALKFPGDQSKQIILEELKPSSFSISGKCPDFTMALTCDLAAYKVLLGGQKRVESTSEGRSGLVLMDLDKDGNPCFADIDHRQVSVAGVVRYIFELAMATSKPNRPVN